MLEAIGTQVNSAKVTSNDDQYIIHLLEDASKYMPRKLACNEEIDRGPDTHKDLKEMCQSTTRRCLPVIIIICKHVDQYPRSVEVSDLFGQK